MTNTGTATATASITVAFDDCIRETIRASVGRGARVHTAYRWTYTAPGMAYKNRITVQCGATFRAGGGQTISETDREVTCTKCLR